MTADEQKDFEELKGQVRAIDRGRLLTLRPPDQLYHYTTVDGLLGIVQTRCLLATNVRFMSDFSELDYAIAKTRGMLVELIPDSAPEYEVQFRNQLHQSIGELGNYQVYGFCFSEKQNELAMWREYGAKGSGYSIGFDPLILQEQVTDYLSRQSEGILPMLTKVQYDPKEQEEQLHMYLDIAVTAMRTKKLSPEVIQSLNAWVGGYLTTYMAGLKSRDFGVESEWRLAVIDIDGNHNLIKMRSANGYLTPYLPISCSKAGQEQLLPIRSIVQGPHVLPDVGEKALQTLLSNNNYSGVKTSSSSITVRRF
jgi:hypothetical protein